MNALRQNLLPILALTDAQSERICQVNRDLSMERTHEKKLKKEAKGSEQGAGRRR